MRNFNAVLQRVDRVPNRNAIEQAWVLGAGERVAKVFGQPVFFENSRLTNSEFIATLAEFIRLEL